MMTPEERERITRAVGDFQAGKDREGSFRILFDSYYGVVQGFFAQRVATAEDRLDLTQETFLRVYKGLEGYRREANFGTWLFRIAFNTHLKWVRRGKGEVVSLESVTRGPAYRGDEPPARIWGRGGPGEIPPTPLDDTLQHERQRRLREAIEDLPRQMSRCTRLRVYRELSYREISVVMKLSIDTVKVHLFQARKKLREKLRNTAEEIVLEELGR